MQGTARVLIVGRDDADDMKLAEALADAGFESSRANIAQSAAELAGSRIPDVVILNMQSDEARANPRVYLALAETLKQSALSNRMRIMCAGASGDLKLEGTADVIDDLLIGDVNPDQVCHRLRSLVRLNTMHEELIRRLGTSAKYGLDAPPPITPPGKIENATVLVLSDGTDFGDIEMILAKRTTLVGTRSGATALDYLRRRPFDAVVISSGRDTGPYLDFVREVRRDSRQFNLPIVLLADRDGLDGTSSLYETGITDAIAKPYSSDELRIRIDTLVRESRFRDSLKQIYAQARHFVTSDALTGLYNRGFLLEHLDSVMSDAARTSQGFSLAGVTIANMEQINLMLGYAGGDRVIRQVGETIAMLIRGEDLACRYSGCKFAVLLPDTGIAGASYALQRIKGVIMNTEFAVDGHYHPISVALDMGIAGFEKGDTADSMLDRCWTAPLKAAA